MGHMKAAKILALIALALVGLATCDADPATSPFCAEKFCEPGS